MQLYISGLPEDTAEDELRELFSKIGAVEQVTIVKDIASGKPKGIGLVKMPNSQKGEEAIKRLNGSLFGGRQIMVSGVPEMLPGEFEFREWLREHALEVLRKVGIGWGQRVLDYGCGPGVYTIPCAQIVGAAGKVYALDVRPDPLVRVREKAEREGLSNIETILQDRVQLTASLPDGGIDVVLVYDVMHDIREPLALLKELYRVLKPAGLLSIFPMHLGTAKMLEIMKGCSFFCFRDRYAPPRHKTASEILNYDKC